MEIKLECGGCGQRFLLDGSPAEQTFDCPNCGRNITVQQPATPPVVSRELQTNIKQGAGIGGWICFGLGCVVMFIPLPTWFIYGPLYLASFTLSIVAMAQGRIASGAILLLVNIICVPVLYMFAVAVGILTWSGWVDNVVQQVKQDPTTVLAAAQVAEDTGSVPATTQFEKIEGAFGVRLGDVFDLSQALGNRELGEDSPMYGFATEKGFRSFKLYYVVVTPTTHRICCIVGTGSLKDRSTAEKEQAVVLELLKEKYGEPFSNRIFRSLGNIATITQGQRYIVTKITGLEHVSIEIRYCDKELMDLAEKERLAAEVEKVDKTAL